MFKSGALHEWTIPQTVCRYFSPVQRGKVYLNSAFTFVPHLHVYIVCVLCAHVCMCMHTHLCACACGGPRLMMGTILSHSSSTLHMEAGSLEARPRAHWHGYSH